MSKMPRLENVEKGANKALAAESRARLVRERHEAEQKRRLDELRAQAAAADALRQKRDEERRQRQAEQRQADEERRKGVEERNRLNWEQKQAERKSALEKERERTQRIERERAALRPVIRADFAFGSSIPRESIPFDSSAFSLRYDRRASSTTNVMHASTPLTRPASALQLHDLNDEKSPGDYRSSVARRRTDLVPTMVVPRKPGRAYSMTRLDRIPGQKPLRSSAGSLHHINRAGSGETSPRSRPGSALSNPVIPVVVRRPNPGNLRRPRPVTVAGNLQGDFSSSVDAAKAKPPIFRKPKPPKETDKIMQRSQSRSKTHTRSPSPPVFNTRYIGNKMMLAGDNNQVCAKEVSRKLGALQLLDSEKENEASNNQNIGDLVNLNVETQSGSQKLSVKTESGDTIEIKCDSNITLPNQQQDTKTIVQQQDTQTIVQQQDTQTNVEVPPKVESQAASNKDITQENEMTASMRAKRITTEEEAKAALAERRRQAREALERQAELEKQRLQFEADEEAERQRLEEERQRRDEEEAKELAALQRRIEEEKLEKAIQEREKREREESERKAREEALRLARLEAEAEKRLAAEKAKQLRQEEAEREEKERLLRKKKVDAIMARTRMKTQAEEAKKQQMNQQPATSTPAPVQPAQNDNGNNGNGNVTTDDLLGLATNVIAEQNQQASETNNGNVPVPLELQPTSNIGRTSASLIEMERMSSEVQTKLPENGTKLIEDDYTAHNGHGPNHNHPLTLQNAI